MDDTQRTWAWRKTYKKVHPLADRFDLMSDEKLAALGADIKANGLREPITVDGDRTLLDGRNRLAAMELAGVEKTGGWWHEDVHDGDPIAFIISKNIHRRHLTKQQQADLIVEAVKAGADPSPSWRGVTADPVKAAAIATAKALPNPISKRTIERAFARATPKPKAVNRSERGHTIMRRPGRPKSGPVYSARGIDAARQYYLRHAELAEDLDAEQEIVFDALLEIAGKRALNGGKSPSRASTLPQDGRSEDGSL